MPGATNEPQFRRLIPPALLDLPPVLAVHWAARAAPPTRPARIRLFFTTDDRTRTEKRVQPHWSRLIDFERYDLFQQSNSLTLKFRCFAAADPDLSEVLL